jgi:murein DD-endopeptidase MepM/ murein hydrolase activator NlpD
MKKRLLSLAMALLMVLSLVCVACPVRAEAATTEEKLQETKAKIADLKSQIETAKANEKEALEQKYLMDQRNAALQEEIELVTGQINTLTERIAENEEKEEAQYELFCRQVRQEEERGTISYWSVLFKASSFTDLLSRFDFVNEVMEYDQSVIDELRSLREQLASDKADLETHKADLSSAKAELEKEVAAAEALAKEYAATADGLQAMYDAEEAAAAQMEAELKEAARRLEEEQRRAREAAAAQQNSGSGSGDNSTSTPINNDFSSSSSGGYIWPTNNTRLITSPVGGRASPGGIGSTNHKGVDIGASYGTDILAAKSGVVISAGWNGGYGYCVIIQHGSYGNYTLYGHMSRILVSYGQSVSQGQVIGLVGSTGNSTGPHIHFEIHEGGALKNPLDYLGGWVRGNW